MVVLKTFMYSCSVAILWVAMSFSYKVNKKDPPPLTITIKHVVGANELKLDSVNYKNNSGQDFTVSKFKYYISNLHLKSATSKDVFVNETFLIDEDEPQSKKIALKNVPMDNYSTLEFIIGVDSLHNCSGAQSGALDPVNAMYWAWNTGYIFLKLEGTSKFSKSPGNFFEYHIGGFQQPNNNIRKVTLKLNSTGSANINIKADVLKLFNSQNIIDIEKLSSVTDLKNAGLVADNYATMFEVLK